jgi:flavin reductase (DIM6/NTAB) family NADH-FMN oxidoreductase RutF
VALAERALKAAEEEAKATQNQKEVEEKLSQLRIAVANEQKAYFDKSRELLEQENTIKAEIANEDKARADEAKKQNDEKIKSQEEYNEALLEALQEAEDAEIALIKNQTEQEQKLEKVRHERRMAELEAKQNEYKNDEEMFNAYARQIEAEQQVHADNMAQISYDARMREADERALEWENRIEEARQNGEDYKALTLEMLETQLSEMTQMQGESDAEYKARQLAVKNEILTIKKEQAEEEIRITEEKVAREIELEKLKLSSYASIAGSISSILEATAGDNKRRLKAAKLAALAEVAINQGVAIAQAVKAAGEYPFPINIVTIGASVAGAIAALVPAFQAVNSVKLARGGRVSGAGTSTSDSIPAMLSNGEFVVNARATSMFPELLETINNLGLGLGAPARMEKVTTTRIERDNAEALVKALQQMPAPVVSVEEINRTGRRVEALERLSRLA